MRTIDRLEGKIRDLVKNITFRKYNHFECGKILSSCKFMYDETNKTKRGQHLLRKRLEKSKRTKIIIFKDWMEERTKRAITADMVEKCIRIYNKLSEKSSDVGYKLPPVVHDLRSDALDHLISPTVPPSQTALILDEAQVMFEARPKEDKHMAIINNKIIEKVKLYKKRNKEKKVYPTLAVEDKRYWARVEKDDEGNEYLAGNFADTINKLTQKCPFILQDLHATASGDKPDIPAWSSKTGRISDARMRKWLYKHYRYDRFTANNYMKIYHHLQFDIRYCINTLARLYNDVDLCLNPKRLRVI